MTNFVRSRRGMARPQPLHVLAGVLLAMIAVLAAVPTLAAARRARRTERCAGTHARVGQVPRRVTERATVCLLNVQRAEHGLPALTLSSDLVASAQDWTEAMVSHRAFTHGTDFGERISATGFRWSEIGENIADGYRTPAGVVSAWMRSLGHCQNILDPNFREVGAGFLHASAAAGGWRAGTWTLDLGLAAHQRAPSADWAPAAACPY